jgi:hypothetical protein
MAEWPQADPRGVACERQTCRSSQKGPEPFKSFRLRSRNAGSCVFMAVTDALEDLETRMGWYKD